MTDGVSADRDRPIEVEAAVDAGLVIRPSPFARQRLVDARSIDQIRLVVAQSPMPGAIEAQLGQLLVSALLFGALLDRTLWDFWLTAIATDDWSNGYVAFELDTGQPRRPTRRWFVDPTTMGFLDRLNSNGGVPDAPVDADACATAFLALCDGGSIGLGDLVKLTEAWWRLRLPGLFVGYAKRATTSASVPELAWHRIETGKQVAVAKRPRSYSITPSDSSQIKGADFVRLQSLLREASKEPGKPSSSKLKREAWSRIDGALHKGEFTTPWGIVLARWQCERLQPVLNIPYQKKDGVTPKWASKLLGIVDALFGNEPPDEAEPDGADLEELYLDFIEQNASLSVASDRMLAFYSFHKFMEIEAGWPFIEFKIHEMDVRATADAALVGINDFQRALETAGPHQAAASARDPEAQLAMMRRLILTLGYRAGLRIAEVMDLTMDDLRHHINGVELLIRTNVHRRVKSINSRRLLPLDLFLEPAERDDLVEWHQRRTRILGQPSASHRLFALDGGNDRLDKDEAEEWINRALKNATGDENTIFHHLRHSFGSYLLATLSLPAEHEIVVPAGLDETCISQSRKAKLLPALTGHGLGRSSLYAVSAMLGHARTTTTLHTYIHLLDWGLAQYVARPLTLSDVRPDAAKCPVPMLEPETDEPPYLEEQEIEYYRLLEAPKPIGEVPAEWRGLAHSVTGVRSSDGTIVLPGKFGIDLADALVWEGRMNEIAKFETQRGSRRHRVFGGPTDSGSSRQFRSIPKGKKSPRFHLPDELWPMTIPRNGPESDFMNEIWRNRGLVETDDDVRQCVTTFLAKLDPIRCDVPLKPGQEAMKFHRSLCALWISHKLIRGRHQYRGSPDLFPRSHLPETWDGKPGGMTSLPSDPHRVSQIRLSVVTHDKSANADGGEASYAWRYAMVLLAATSTIDLAAVADPPQSARTQRRKRMMAGSKQPLDPGRG